MTSARIETTHLFPGERAALLELLRELAMDEWNRPTVCDGWNVHDVVLHLLGGDIGLLAGGRDRFHGSSTAPLAPDLTDWDTLVSWIDERNATWVEATRRISPVLLCELLAFTGEDVAGYLAAVDLDAAGIPVSWAGPGPAPTWLHVAREYTERWTHQQHIRDAVGRPGLTSPEWLHPVLDTFARALPHTLRDAGGDDGTTVELRITGPAGGTWQVQRVGGDWRLLDREVTDPGSVVEMAEEIAWRGFTRGIDVEQVRAHTRIDGDREIGDAIMRMVTIIA